MMNKYKIAGIVTGMTLLIVGISALILSLVGVHWYFLSWLEAPGRLFAFLFKLFLALAGAVIFFVSNVDWERERRESK